MLIGLFKFSTKMYTIITTILILKANILSGIIIISFDIYEYNQMRNNNIINTSYKSFFLFSEKKNIRAK